MDWQLEEQAAEQRSLDGAYDKRQSLADKLRNFGRIQNDTEQLTTTNLLDYFNENKAELIPTEYLVMADQRIDDDFDAQYLQQSKELMRQAAYELVEINCKDLENWE